MHNQVGTSTESSWCLMQTNAIAEVHQHEQLHKQKIMVYHL